MPKRAEATGAAVTILLPRRSTFNDWPAERQKYDLLVDDWIIEDGLRLTAVIRSRTGQEIQFDDEVKMQPKKSNLPIPERPDRKESKLGYRLETMLEAAYRKPGDTQTITLKSGLRIDLNLGIDGQTRILLARQGVDPSETEWNMIQAHFPYTIPLEAAPEHFEHRGWHCLRAAWPTPESVRSGEQSE
jgi:hypothetical protein